jgi:hypothetical protein
MWGQSRRRCGASPGADVGPVRRRCGADSPAAGRGVPAGCAVARSRSALITPGSPWVPIIPLDPLYEYPAMLISIHRCVRVPAGMRGCARQPPPLPNSSEPRRSHQITAALAHRPPQRARSLWCAVTPKPGGYGGLIALGVGLLALISMSTAVLVTPSGEGVRGFLVRASRTLALQCSRPHSRSRRRRTSCRRRACPADGSWCALACVHLRACCGSVRCRFDWPARAGAPHKGCSNGRPAKVRRASTMPA